MHTREELMACAVREIGKADCIIFIVGEKLNSFSNWRDSDYGPVQFWGDYPELRDSYRLPENMLDEGFMREQPETFWGLINML